MAMRRLKHHEQKLLRKVDFLSWKHESNLREIQVMRRYHIQDREDYVRCARVGLTFCCCGHVTPALVFQQVQ